MLLGQFLRFAGVGVIGTIGHYATLIFVVEILDYDPVLGSTIGFLTGALINYFLNRHFTFTTDARHSVALPKFIAVATVGMVINAMVMAAMSAYLTVHYLVAQVIATGLVLIWNFAANKYWTFADYS